MSAATQVQAYRRKEYLMKFMKNDVRPDYRKLGETRPVLLNYGSITTADGSALIKLGETVVYCGITAEATKPVAGDNEQGILDISVELSPLGSARFRPRGRIGQPTDKALILSKFVEDVLDGSGMLDRTQLNIETGKFCWTLHTEAICYNCDGNLKDAVLLAIVAALKDLKIPTATYDEDEEVIAIDTDKKFSLCLSTIPVPLTFSILDESILLVDPTQEEESVSDGTVSIVMSGLNSVCRLTKHSGPPLTEKQIELCITKANERWTYFTETYFDIQMDST